MKKAIKKSEVLIEALPYIKKFFEKIIVIKYGGAAVEEVAAVKLDARLVGEHFHDPSAGGVLDPGGHAHALAAAQNPAVIVAAAELDLLVVKRIDGLRVVDASAMPYVTNGNIYAPVMMLAEKAADLILGNTPLPAEPVPFYRHVPAAAPV